VNQLYSSKKDVVFAEVVSGRDVHVDSIETVGGPTIGTIATRFTYQKE
jgi:hypothetical protein